MLMVKELWLFPPDGRHHKDILTSFDSLKSPISLDFDKKENRFVHFIFDVEFKG